MRRPRMTNAYIVAGVALLIHLVMGQPAIQATQRVWAATMSSLLGGFICREGPC